MHYVKLYFDPDILLNQLKDLRLVGKIAGVTDTILVQWIVNGMEYFAVFTM